MHFGIIKYPVVDMRAEPKFRSERIHQMVFGESVEIKGEIENEYIYACDLRLNYCGYLNKNCVWTLSKNEYEEFIKLDIIKVKKPFCKTDGWITYMLPIGSRIYTDTRVCYLPNGKIFQLVDDPSLELNDIVNLSVNFIGVPYLWGGTSSYGFDCSGFVNRLYDALNINIPRDAHQQEESLECVRQPEPGDLLFMEGHVMLYIGDNKVIHANGHDMCVSITDLDKEDYGRYLKNKIRKVCTVSKI
ncbi:MAG: C40 family peptidase [Fervidobacterium sp.]